MIDDIEDTIIKNKEYSGVISRKERITSIEGKDCILVFTAKWTNAEDDGTGRILITIDELVI